MITQVPLHVSSVAAAGGTPRNVISEVALVGIEQETSLETIS